MYRVYLKKHPEMKTIVARVKELFLAAKQSPSEMSKLIDTYLVPQQSEKKQNAEVSTPYSLRQDMLDSVPQEFWTSPKKIFEPCCGKGGFVLDVVNRFMTGLQAFEPNEKKRYKKIVEECIYFADINPVNIFVTKLLLDPKEEYALQYHEGDTLQLSIVEKWDLEGFDLVVGNPPYNSSGSTATGNTLWPQFVMSSLDQWLCRCSGRLLFVHPPGWRKPPSERSKYNELFKKMVSENHMIHLTIAGHKKGKEVFKCGTRYDWYLICRRKEDEAQLQKETLIIDETEIQLQIDIRNFPFLPNSDISTIERLLPSPQIEESVCKIIYNRTNYATDNTKWVSKEKKEEYKYPLVHSTAKSGNLFYYSSRTDKGHFGISKVIFGQTGIYDVIIDLKGEYGMTDNAMAIEVKTTHEAEEIKNVLMSSRCTEWLKSCSWSNYRIDWRLFTYLKENWWKELI